MEIERKGATVVQLNDVRISIARTPFSDALEITAVRPIASVSLDDYKLSEKLKDRLSDYNRGVFISGPPGSGKSTFAQSVAEYLRLKNYIVKTMESPRDLQVHDEITQYAPLEGSMEKTADILLLVRPDYTIYDEVRKTDDFKIFADMRLAGMGLIGVVHANRAIDAIQRLIGRVELGIIPQVVDTIVHIERGAIQEVYELDFTVKVPSGMVEQDLARPVIEVKNFEGGKALYEIYTYGEQVVVMPVKEKALSGETPIKRLAALMIAEEIKPYCRGRVEAVVADDNNAVVYVDKKEVARLIGKGGQLISAIERELGIHIDVQTFDERPGKKRKNHNE
jgi:ATPase